MSEPVELRGLIVVVGPNSSGKSQFLHDINEVVMGRRRQLVVVSRLEFNAAPDFEEYFALLITNGAIVQLGGNNYRKHSFQFGTEEGGGSVDKSDAKAKHSIYARGVANHEFTNAIPTDAFLNRFGPLTCSALFLKNRLTLMDSCPNFDRRGSAPEKTLQSLHWNIQAKELLQGEIASTFKRGVWIDSIGHHNHLVVRVADTPAIPSAEDRLEPATMESYRGIETEGDGIRSYAAICAALLLERRPLCLIDEPEMCLHPPQAHAIGRFIGRHVSDNSCTIIATHSSHVLRGILECNPMAHVIRMTRNGGRFAARLLKPDALIEATSKPRARSEAILEGLFAQGVVLGEAEGDRMVYEATYRSLKDRKLDIRFIPSEGTGGFADPLRLYRSLGVPSAVIADLDFLRKDAEVKKVLGALGAEGIELERLCKSARTMMNYVKSAAACRDLAAVRAELKALSEPSANSSLRDDEALRGKLLNLADQMYRLRQLQQGGIESIPEQWNDNGQGEVKISLRENVRTLVKELKSHGLFLVPVGELESWMPVLMKGNSREDKSKWAMIAAEKIEELGERQDDVWLFIRSVAQFLSDQLGSAMTESGTVSDTVNRGG